MTFLPKSIHDRLLASGRRQVSWPQESGQVGWL